MQIRNETPVDAGAIEAVTIAAFEHAPHTDPTEHFIVRALRRAHALSVSLVAEDDGEIVGHVAISPVSISDGAAHWYGLGPISVLPQRQGQGVGTQLMQQALAALRALGAAGCVVLGDPQYYARFGFTQQPALTLPGVPQEYFQALVFGVTLPEGSVTYHSAFSATAE